MIRAFLQSTLGLTLTLVLFVTGINGLFPVVTELNQFLIAVSDKYAEVFPWLGMDSTGIRLFISLAKTMAAFVYMADVFGFADNCMNAFVWFYVMAIFCGAAYFNYATQNFENLGVSIVLIVMALLRQAVRRPAKY